MLICKLKTDFTAESRLPCMWCPPTRVRKQKKKKSNFALNSVRFRLQENVRLQQCVHTEFDCEVQRRLKSVHIYIA